MWALERGNKNNTTTNGISNDKAKDTRKSPRFLGVEISSKPADFNRSKPPKRDRRRDQDESEEPDLGEVRTPGTEGEVGRSILTREGVKTPQKLGADNH